MATEDVLREYLKKAIADAHDAQSRLEQTRQRVHEPIAIIGMGCRFPGGVASPEELWELVRDGIDAIGSMPNNRGWDTTSIYDPDPDAPGKAYSLEGGFLYAADEFDPAFFGINRRQAQAIDPQHRLLLETSHEALERAGIIPASLAGRPVGVYTGIAHGEYGANLAPLPEELEGYVGIGHSPSVASGRIAYTYGFTGPAITVDTACSSSLVAIKLALNALRTDECELALAGGASVIPNTNIWIEFARQRGLATDGRCKSFDDAADGTAWSEGAGMLLLARLSDALANDWPIAAIIRGAAVNQDGASNGLTAPNGLAQQNVIRAALDDAELRPDQVDAVDAHGTGTSLGDPIEADALLAVYGKHRPTGHPLRLGSLKSNIGHTQAAAGVGAIIKMTMALQHETLPRSLHLKQPSRHVDWGSGAIELLTENAIWRRGDQPRRAGVSAFGISGTNVHLIIEEAPKVAKSTTDTRSAPAPLPVLISAKTSTAVAAQAARLADHLRPVATPITIADIALSVGMTRTAYPHRAVVTATTISELSDKLAAVARDEQPSGVHRGVAANNDSLTALFTGQGAQSLTMGRSLAADPQRFPAFAAAFEAACAAVDARAKFPLRDVLWGNDAERLNRTDCAQASLFAIEVALFRHLESLGVEPRFLVGHSVGEITAAHVAGVLSLEDAATMVVARGATMAELPRGGAMIAIAANIDRVMAVLPDGVNVAAINGPNAVVVSGTEQGCAKIAAHFNAAGIKTNRLAVSHAFHSAQMEPMLDEFESVVAGLQFASAHLTIVSTVTGQPIDAELATPQYWVNQVRSPVRFSDAVQHCLSEGTQTFVECGPGGILSALIPAIAEARGQRTAVAIPMLTRTQSEPQACDSALARLISQGVDVDWTAVVQSAGRIVDLPTHAFARERYWLDPRPLRRAPDVESAGIQMAQHPMLDGLVENADSDRIVLTALFSLERFPWLGDHTVGGEVLVPGTALVELALHGAEVAGLTVIEELVCEIPLVMTAAMQRTIQVVVESPEDDGSRAIEVYSRSAGEHWVRHAAGRAGTTADGAEMDIEYLDQWPPVGTVSAGSIEDTYLTLASDGLDYGPAFRGLRAAWCHPDDPTVVYADVDNPDLHQVGDFGVHPALLDAALHSMRTAGLLPGSDDGGPKLPFVWSGVRRYADGTDALRVRITSTGPNTVTIDAFDSTGALVLRVETLVLRASQAVKTSAAKPLYHTTWARKQTSPNFADDVNDPRTIRVPSHRADVADTVTAVLAELREALDTDRHVVVVTTAAVAVEPGDQINIAAAAAWSATRSVATEFPGRVRLVDQPPANDEDVELRLADWSSSDDPELALRHMAGTLVAYRPQLSRVAPAKLTLPLGSGWQIGVGTVGSIDGLSVAQSPAATRDLAPGEVRIAVRAAGLNFRDVMITLGLYPGDAEIGGEGAGLVTEVGEGVTGVAPGDRVMGIFPGAFAETAIADHRLITPIPHGWTFAQAAGVPIVYCTAYYALHDLGHLTAGQRILVHAGAGGVGIAAMALAQHLGAHVYATASPGKWHALRAAGLTDDRIANSRTLEFSDGFAGAGPFDLVLNSLSGDFVDASARLLRAGGKFLEMGKTDIRESVGQNIDYQAFDLGEAGTDRIKEMLEVLGQMFGDGIIAPPTITAWDIREAQTAVRFLQQGRNIGKIVLTIPAEIRCQGTALVTGGTGALGAVLALHLAEEHQVAHLLLVSRRGLAAPGAQDVVTQIRETGATVDVIAADLTDPDDVDVVMQAIPPDHPLTLVLHAAGIADDALLAGQTPQRVSSVISAKVDSAQLILERCRAGDVARIELFSSVSALLGGMGQANYAAANAALDALATQWRSKGLPVQSIQWGLWQVPSTISGNLTEADIARIRRTGTLQISNEDGAKMLAAAIDCSNVTVAAVPVDLDVVRKNPSAPTLLADLARSTGGSADRAGRRRRGPRSPSDPDSARAFSQMLAQTSPPEREAATIEFVKAQVADILGHPDADQIGADTPFLEIGVDSLTGVELRNRMNQLTGLSLAPTAVMDNNTAELFARHLLTTVEPRGETENPVNVVASVAQGAETATGSLTQIFRSLCERNQYAAAWDVLLGVSHLCETFGREERTEHGAQPVTLGNGCSPQKLICFPGLSALSGVHEFVRLAKRFDGQHDVVAIPAPGLTDGRHPPDAYDTLIDVQTETVLQIADGAPFTLIGRSGGGWIAHAVAANLEARGHPPRGLILVDSHVTIAEWTDKYMVSMLRGMLDRDRQIMNIRDVAIAALGAYLKMFVSWSPTPIATPTLQLRAADMDPADFCMSEDDKATWRAHHDVVEVPGDHFTILEDHSDTTAAAIEDWLKERAG